MPASNLNPPGEPHVWSPPGPPAEPAVPPETEPGFPVEPHGLRPAVSKTRRRRTFDPSRLSLVLVAILAGGAIFVGGFSLGSRVATTPGTPADQEARFAPFWDVYSLIQDQFAGSPK